MKRTFSAVTGLSPHKKYRSKTGRNPDRGVETIYFAHGHKGHEGVEGTPAEVSGFGRRYLGILRKADFWIKTNQ